MTAEGVQFLWRWNDGMISLNLGVIWEMSGEMTHKTNAQKILEILTKRPGLDDDELSLAAEISPRQTVNQECRLLQARGSVLREIGPRGKIVNYLTAGFHGQKLSRKHRVITPHAKPLPDMPGNLSAHQGDSARVDPAQVLFIIPCSKRKEPYNGKVIKGPSILDHLPSDLAGQLDAARKANIDRAQVDETSLVPAWKRYSGTLYVSTGRSLVEAVAEDLHVLILSGGYGVVLATEPIGMYEAVFKPSWWPRGLIEKVLSYYVAQNGLTTVRAIVPASTAYREIVERVDWRAAGVQDAILLTPERVPGATIKAPRAQGEALTALLDNTFVEGWTSSDGISLCQHRLLSRNSVGNLTPRK